MSAFHHLFRDLCRILYPAKCYCCGELLVGDEHEICTHCFAHLPFTEQIDLYDNITEQRLNGRIPLTAGGSLLIFQKGNSTQTILHQIKYYRNTRLAILMGRQLGYAIKKSSRFDDIDAIIPVPLHWIRKWQRGYNQSELLARGITQIFNKPILTNILYRKHYTKTQTHKTREERISNMQNVFAVRNTKKLQNKHILLIDDVITTGTTTEACYTVLKNIPGLKISVISLAIVHNN